MSGQHTPGPWVVDADKVGGGHQTRVRAASTDRTGRHIATTMVQNSIPMSFEAYELRLVENAANARLIAAAPDLLEAAKALIADVRRRYPGEDLRCPYMIALDAAIAKATTP